MFMVHQFCCRCALCHTCARSSSIESKSIATLMSSEVSRSSISFVNATILSFSSWIFCVHKCVNMHLKNKWVGVARVYRRRGCVQCVQWLSLCACCCVLCTYICACVCVYSYARLGIQKWKAYNTLWVCALTKDTYLIRRTEFWHGWPPMQYSLMCTVQ